MPPIDLPIFEPERTRQRLLGDQALLSRLLASFIESHRGTMVRLNDWLAHDEPGQALVLLHTLKGAAAMLGTARLAATAGELEQCLKAGGVYASTLAELTAVHAATLAALTAYLDDSPTMVIRTEPPCPADLAADLAALLPYLREHELIPAPLLATLREQGEIVPTACSLADLLRCIDRFDYQRACEETERLLAKLSAAD